MFRNPKLRIALLAVLILAAFATGLLLGGGGGDNTGSPEPEGHDHTSSTPEIWTCSMHPQIQLPEPGKCPICFMDLIPLEKDEGMDEGPRTLAMSEAAASLAEIMTTEVVRRPVSSEVRLIGTVTFDETRFREISAWVPGRIDTLFVNFTGIEVEAGEKLVSLYSPELFAAQSELLNALEADREVSNSTSEYMRSSSLATIDAARNRLRLWGLGDDQIARVESTGRASYHLDIPAPIGGIVMHKNAFEGQYVKEGSKLYKVADLSKVWIDLEAYESDLAWLREGQEVDFTVEAFPGERMTGDVVFIDPFLKGTKRTVGLRLEVDNQDGRLKPGMFASATISASSANQEAPLVIPATAPLITGKRAVVYVQLPERERPTFEGRVIELGPRAGDHYVVASGLSEGEFVVVKGNFKIDSALQIQAKPSMMNPQGGGSMPGHDHGEGATRPIAQDDQPDKIRPFETPLAFRTQLDTVLEAYLSVQEALAADDDPAAKKAATRMIKALAAVDMGLLEGEAHRAWMDDLSGLDTATDLFVSANGIEGRRQALVALTETLWTTLNRYGPGRTDTIRLFNCPMANENDGADWLQLATGTSNPYFGASMLRCGSQIDSLGSTGNAEVQR